MVGVTVSHHEPAIHRARGARSPRWPGKRAFAARLWLRGRDTPLPLAGSADPPQLRAAAAQSGKILPPDTRAYDAFFTQHEQPLYGYLRRMVPSDEVALELAQESFFRAWQHFDEVSAYTRPGAWLFRIATNLAISHRRRRLPIPFAHLPATHLDDDLLAGERFADPHDFASDWAERDAIERALLQLPERHRAALLLRAVHGLSCDEIAQALGISPVAARKILSRGRERFRALYLADQSSINAESDAFPRKPSSSSGGQQ